MHGPLQTDSIVHTETSRKRKGKHISKNDEAPKEEEEEGGAHHSPQRKFSPQLASELPEIPSARATEKKGKMLLFPSPTTTVEIEARRPFTRSSNKN